MDITGISTSSVAVTPGQGVPADVQTLMLNKVLTMQAQTAAQMLAALPPPLASDGSVGTQLHAIA